MHTVFFISYRRQHSEQGVTNPVYMGDAASNKHQFDFPIYEEIKEVYDHSGQPHTTNDDYDDVDRLSIKSDDVTNTCKSSEPLPPPRQKEICTTNGKATTQLVAASLEDEYASLKNCTSGENLAPSKQQEAVVTTTHEPEDQLVAEDTSNDYTIMITPPTASNDYAALITPPTASDDYTTMTTPPTASNDYAALITPPTASAGVYQELVAAPPVPPGYDVPSNIPATSPVTNTIEDNNSKSSS